jgi:hypothetical protein
MKVLNFEGYEQRFFKGINLKIVAEVLKLPEGEELLIRFGDGEIILKKIKGVYNAHS